MPFFAGREQEQRLLIERVNQASESHGSMVLIEGEAGLGKTRLVDEVAAAAEAAGTALAIRGGCSEEERGAQYQPVVEALRRYIRLMSDKDLRVLHGAAREIVKVLPELTCRIPNLIPSEPLPTSQERVRLFEALLQLMNRIAADRTLLIVLEDLHWADDSTLALIRYLSRELRQARALFLLTYRPEEVPTGSPLATFISEVVARDGQAVVRLQPFTWVETRVYVRRSLGLERQPSTLLLDKLYERAEGNPFFTQQLLQSIDMTRTREYGVFPSALESLPDSLMGVLRRRIDLLDADAKSVLEQAAIIGRTFTIDLLSALMKRDRDALVRVLRDPVRRGLLVDRGLDTPDTFEFRHKLMQEAAVGLLLPSEQRRLHLEVAACIERVWSERHPGRTVALAYHYDRAGTAEKVRIHAEEAGDLLVAGAAPTDAVSWYRRALSAAKSMGETEPLVLLEKAAGAARDAREFQAAAEWLGQTAQLHEKSGRMRELGEALSREGRIWWLAGEPAKAVEVFHRAQTLLEPYGESHSLARTRAGIANSFLTAFKGLEAYQLAQDAHAMALRTKADDVLPQTLRILGSIMAAMRNPDRGIALLREGLRRSLEQDDELEVTSAFGNLVNAYVKSADWVAAEQVAKEGMAYFKARRGRSDYWIASKLVEVYRLTGRWDDAESLAKEADSLLDERNGQDYLLAGIGRCLLIADRGRWEELQQRLQELLPAAERSGEFQSLGVALYLLSRLSVANGDLESAVAHAERALVLLRSTTDAFHGLPLLLHACAVFTLANDCGAAEKCLQQLRATHDFTESRTALAHLETAEAIVGEACGNRDEAIERLARASDCWQDLGRPYDHARTLVRFGQALLARGCPSDRDEARRRLGVARGIFERLGATETQEIDELLRRSRLVTRRRQSGHILSPREMEVAALVAKGLTNREMAALLFISPKTTEHHLSRILNKLDLSSRSQLAAYVVRENMTQPATSDS